MFEIGHFKIIMKNTTKISILLVSMLFVQYVFAQCKPNSDMPKGAILPDSLKVGYVNVPYSEVIYYRAPLDTTAITQFGVFPVRIDSMEIIKVEGLPTGFTYECNTGNCRFKGGNSGCLTLSGSLSSTGNFPIKVYLKTYATVKTTFADIPQTQEDINEKYTLTINGAVGLNTIDLKRVVSVYPNPVKEYLFINNQSASNCSVELIDMMGKKMNSWSFGNQLAIETSQYLPGVYFLQVNIGEERLTRKIIIE
ncbi:MAG: T9SS C-terminal target domain-containing protein [Bacteroidetes bacterium]|nr:MAG: T9SS C-terminal target domain-containing protein [Bacteroidota bacterium]